MSFSIILEIFFIIIFLSLLINFEFGVCMYDLILFFTLSSCGYSKIYNNETNIKIKINVLEAEGDSKINNILMTTLNNISISPTLISVHGD